MRGTKLSRYWRFGCHVICGSFVVALVTVLAYLTHLHLGIPSFLFLLTVVTLSLVGGFAEAAVVSVVAVGCLDYFLTPPLLEWQITDPVDTESLVTFWATSLIITRLASNSKRQAQTAEKRRKDAAAIRN